MRKSSAKLAVIARYGFAAVICLLPLLLALFLGVAKGLFGTSDYYRLIDKNADGDLSFVEWIENYATPAHQHSIAECARRHFYEADCNQDDSLTWREYHDYRFRRKHCPDPAVQPLEFWIASTSAEATVVAEADGPALSTHRRKSWEEALGRYYGALRARENALKDRYNLD